MLPTTVSAQSPSALARLWQIIQVERGPDFRGMTSAPDPGSTFDLTGLQPLPLERPGHGPWLVEASSRQRIQYGDGRIDFNSSDQVAPVRIPFYYEVLLVTPERLRLAVCVQLPQAPQPQHWLTYDLKPAE